MKYRIALLLTLAVATAAALTLAGTGTAAKQTVRAQTMTVLMFDFRFKLSKPSVTVGKVTILLKNKGHSIHNFVVTGVKSSPFLAPGTQKTYTITFKKKGKFNYVCTVPRHAELGMNGTLVVK